MFTISRELKEFLEPSRRLWLVLWFAMTFSMVIYVLVAFLVSRQHSPADLSSGLLTAFGGIAAVATLASLLIPRFLPSDDRLRSELNSDFDPESLARNPQTGSVNQDRLQKIALVAPYEQKFMVLPFLYFTPFILRLVINEAVAIFGLVLSILSHSLAPMLPFIAVAIILNLAAFPRLDPMIERASRLVR